MQGGCAIAHILSTYIICWEIEHWQGKCLWMLTVQMKKNIPAKAITQMNAKEPGQGTKEFEREFVADSFGPPGPMARDQWRRAKRKRGRPRQGRGA
jgi:hypothetical protein